MMVALVTVVLFVPLVAGIALFTDAFSSPVVAETLLAGAGALVGFGVVYPLTLFQR